MPETAVKTREQIAVTAIQDIFNQENYRPQFLKDLIKACRVANQTSPSPEAIIINDKSYSVRDIREHLAKFVYMLPPEDRPAFNDESLYDDSFLENLSGIIEKYSGLAPAPPPANIPQNLEALKEFYAAHQSAVQARSQRQGWSKEKFREELAAQNAITIELGITKQVVRSRLYFVIDNSEYLENTAAALGVKPEQLKLLAKKRLDYEIDRAMTAAAYRQVREFYKNPSWLATKFVKDIQSSLPPDDLIGPAIATNRKNTKEAWRIIKQTAQEEIAKAKPAIEAAAENLQEHPTVAAAARRAAQEAVKQVETVSLGRPPLKPAKTARLAEALARHPDNPGIQEKIIRSALGATSAQAKIIRGQLAPQINQLAASTQRFNPLLAADPTGILADALRNPGRFPKPFVDAIKSGKISDDQIATIIQTANLLGVPVSAVTFSYFGVESSQVKTNLTRGRDALPADHPTIVTLSRLASAQAEINKARQQNLLPPSLEKDMESSIRHYARAVRWNKFTKSINPFRLFTGIGDRLNEIPQFSGTLSGFRVQSGPIDSVFNLIGSLGNTTRSLPGFITRPFAAVGNAISNTIINPVKTWANTQIKSGLARAGAWLAKKGVTEAAKKVGAAIIGKGTAALLAQAVPVAGQIFAAALIGGDILKFLWEHKDKVGMFLGGMFLWGQMMLGNLIHLVSSLGTLGLTTGIGALLGTIFIPIPFVGTAIGAAAGFSLGLAINAAGGLGAALSGLGSALGSAAAGLSSFIGAITAPSAFIGLAHTIASVSIFVSLGVGGYLIFQNQWTMFGGLFVAPDSGAFPPGGGYIPPEVLGSCPIPGGALLCGSFTDPNSPYCQHGDNSYWGGGRTPCDWPIPLSDVTNCTYNNVSGSVCNKGNNTCPWYGFAADFRYTPAQCNLPVYLPSLNGQSLNWEVVGGGTWRSGEWGMLRATDGTNVYEMLFGHLIGQPVGGSSGTQAGTLFCGPNHLHVELRINGEYVRPDSLCPGIGFIVTPPTPAPPPGFGPRRR